MKEDLEEQDMFIQKTILLGKPALKSVLDLNDQYQELESKVKQDMKKRITGLLDLREKISQNNKKIGTLVRRDVRKNVE